MAEQVWKSSRSRFLSAVVGPHFEQICREWVTHFAAPETFEGMPIDVSCGTVPGRTARTSHEVDVVVRGAVGQDNGKSTPRPYVSPATAVRASRTGCVPPGSGEMRCSWT
ncbi:hypothetical protein ACH47Z_17645 [Streptomyces sp. NPDC020192]|uniref:hypothetical protein n=1 Tax=Streptomyces sp. NPDC020192 TaxID=3365066 RepID=UPI0037AADCE5